MYGIRYLRVFDYVSVSWCATGPARESEVYPERPQMEKKPTHLSFLLPGDSLPLGVINTAAATRRRNGSHSRGGGGPVRKDQFPLKKIQKKEKSRNPQESLNVSIHSPLILAGILTSSRERGVL